jgi:ABC-type antimicrobial peptide transport system permease subunit
MGIRMALGAQTSDVQWLVMRHAGKVVGLGLLVGLGAAFAGTRGIASLLYDVKPTDPATIAGVVLLLLLTGLLASWLPALRVSRTAPASTLREE